MTHKKENKPTIPTYKKRKKRTKTDTNIKSKQCDCTEWNVEEIEWNIEEIEWNVPVIEWNVPEIEWTCNCKKTEIKV